MARWVTAIALALLLPPLVTGAGARGWSLLGAERCLDAGVSQSAPTPEGTGASGTPDNSLLENTECVSQIPPSRAPAGARAPRAEVGSGPELVPGDPRVYGRSAPPDPGAPMAVRGRAPPSSPRMIVILIEFQDVRHSPGREPEFFSDLLFNSSPGARSLRGYYFENSYGKLEVRGEVTAVWYRSDSNMSFYGADTLSGVDNANGPIHRLVTEAVRKADAEVDFSIFDTDRDGYIDFLIIIHAGQGQESSYQNRDTIWSHRWYDYDEPIVDGVAAGFYTMCSEFSPIGTFAHELGHELGLPDLYDIDGDTLGAGSWDLMSLGSWLDGGATPSHLSAFCKVRLGWIEPMALTASSENLSLQAVELSPSVLKLWVEPPHEYFLIENRQCIGWDAFLPGPGILIWHVDERAADNRDQTLRLVDLEEADEGLNGDSPVQSTDPWRDSEEGFNPGSSPSSSANSGRSTGWWVYKIGPSGNVMGLSVRHVDFDIAVTELRYEVF
ncbi:MAG: M6 family metalloprotease domain-containing protein, partial [Thermoplasmata archaeon]